MDPYSFLGTGIKFPLQIDKKTGYLATVSGEEDIKEAISIILNTYMGERVRRESFGSNIADYVFDTTAVLSVRDISGTIASLLAVQEPRIRDIEVKLDEQAESGKILLNIAYTIRSTNNRYNHVYPFYMNEGNQEEKIV